MRHVALALTFSLCLAPAVARADFSGCTLGPMPGGMTNQSCSLGGQPAAILAAIAAPVLVAGAASTAYGELNKHTVELPDGAEDPATTTRPRSPNLSLMPPAADPYREPPGKVAGKERTRRQPNRAFEFNENATNVVMVATGAMVAGALIATIVKAAK
jgi:hypothetical protein